MSGTGAIIVRGARQHNLKGVDVAIPHHSLTVVTGPSGSGKSSLAFDTLYAEGQRRYVETFSPYTRQFLERMDKPRADAIEGIPPAVAIEQANNVRTARSTVGTMTEIADYVKMLFPRVSRLTCPKCGEEIRPRGPQEIAEILARDHPGREGLIFFEVPFPEGTALPEALGFIRAQGYQRVLEGEAALRIDDLLAGACPDALRRPAGDGGGYRIAVAQDRLAIGGSPRARLIESLGTAQRLGKGRVAITLDGGETMLFSDRWECLRDGITFRRPVPGMFSFNNPLGACPTCRGFGRTMDIDYDLAIPDASRSLKDGAVKPWQTGVSRECQDDLMRACHKRGVPVDIPFRDLSARHRKFVIEGDKAVDWYGVRGFFEWLESKSYKMHVRVFLSRYRAYRTCRDCGGRRFQPEPLNFRIGPAGLSIAEVNALPIRDAVQLFRDLPLPAGDDASELLRDEALSRLNYLAEVGLGYLTLNRATRTLSGGEIQRVNLTTCLGTSLVNTLFVLDEPSIGLHPRDTGRLLGTMRHLRDMGNTVLVVEHDEQIMRAADHILDLGPGRGRCGGEVVFQGPPDRLERNRRSLTAAYLRGDRAVPVPAKRRHTDPARALRIRGARQNNLKGIDVEVPLGALVCFTGVSGSGKSTLVREVLFKNLLRARGQAIEEPGTADSVEGEGLLGQIVMVDQSPLTRTPRSNPLLYTGAYDRVRELFATTEEARRQGLNASAFSFNAGVGRCERCKGMGYEKIEMQFLTDLFVRCPECEGRRFQPHVLAVRYAGRSVGEILDMTVEEGLAFFRDRVREAETAREAGDAAAVAKGLALLTDVGLGYLTLGQPLNQLSGGESQRIKLVGHLAESHRPRARKGDHDGAGRGDLLILDEPTTGLHFDDVRALMAVLQRLVDGGDSVIVIEHNLEVIKGADWIIDLGPEAGDQGGEVVCRGTPEQVARHRASHTGRFLRNVLPGAAPPRAAALSLREKAPALTNGRAPRIEIRGARHHNLKDISVGIPLDGMTVLTGLSGSGKSTLAFDIVFAEGQRRYLDSLNTYARQFVQQFEKPDVDLIRGIPPTVAIEQQTTRGGGKSTVGTVTEIHHFVRLLFAKLGVQHDPDTGESAVRQSPEAIGRALAKLAGRRWLSLLAPLVKARKGFHTEVAKWAQAKGYALLRVDGRWIEPAAFQRLDRFKEHRIDVVVGEYRASLKPAMRAHLVREALQLGKGTLYALDRGEREQVFSTQLYCPGTGRSFEELDPRLFSFNSPHGWCPKCQGYGTFAEVSLDAGDPLERELELEAKRERADEAEIKPCPECSGERLNPVARAVRFQGHGMGDIGRMSVSEALAFFGRLRLRSRDAEIARDILPEIIQRLRFLGEVGLGYLQLGRGARTLSGGESQRIRLAAQLGSNLEGVLYVLDEPTIGLHPRDNERLLDILGQLRTKGNSLLVVEHDEATMRAADHIIDLGPGAGIAGGRIVAQGAWRQIAADERSITGTLLGQPLAHPLRGSRRPTGNGPWLEISGARANNLRDLDFRLPLGRLVLLTGVSGSGKSTLMREVLMPAVVSGLRRRRSMAGRKGATWRSISGAEGITAVYEVDQSPIGKTSRSTPATYTKILDDIRALFAGLPESRTRGYSAGTFSFNSKGGRCEACEGQGAVKVEMNFLPSMYVPCESCGGRRFSDEVLDIQFKGRSIADVLAMGVSEATEFFSAHPRIHRALKLLDETGLGYLTLGQRSPTLSGGEAQRLKLVTELARAESGKFLYLLEEPTIGLHLADVQRLLDVLHRLVDGGHTVVVIEHHLDVIAEADHVIDLGPEGGADGGQIVAAGTPEEIARCAQSHTGRFLREILNRPEGSARTPFQRAAKEERSRDPKIGLTRSRRHP
ncbi:MAG TPA: excinuclease ABC subunit UvrA [Verrucomicrobiae bacterium]|nr:excinuclease ABC subunit UvrA [Verrucomicrobiae bacterium]